MENEMAIQLRQALMMLTKAQNEAAFYKEKARDCVPIEKYNVLKTERDSLLTLCDSLTEEVRDVRKERDGFKASLAEAGFKFQLNVSEQNFIRLLKEGGCDMQQSSLNQMMHADISFIRAFLDNGLIALHNNPIYPNFSFIQTLRATA